MHVAGRTGREGRKGTVVTVVSEAEARGGPLGELRQALGVAIDEVDTTRTRRSPRG